MKYLRKFNESKNTQPRKESEITKIGPILRLEKDDKIVKKQIEDSISVYLETNDDYVNSYVNYVVKMSLQLKRHEIAKYLLSKYKNTYIKSDDVSDILTWVKNTKLNNSEKEEAYDLLSKYVGHIHNN